MNYEKLAKSDITKLTKKEYKAVDQYKSFYYSLINGYLLNIKVKPVWKQLEEKDKKTLEKRIKEIIRIMDGTFRAELNTDIIVYRGIPANPGLVKLNI